MVRVPIAPLVLTAAGVIPFVWGALTTLSPDLAAFGTRVAGPRFVGPYVQLFYGSVILSFMSGVLWGFAAKAGASWGYVLSVIPALWAFFMTGGGPSSASISLMTGFIAVLLLDWVFWRQNLAPDWWLHLRLPVTVIVIACLFVGI